MIRSTDMIRLGSWLRSRNASAASPDRHPLLRHRELPASERIAQRYPETVGREPCARRREIKRQRLAAAVSPDHPARSSWRADLTEVRVVSGEIKDRALTRRHRDPGRRHPAVRFTFAVSCCLLACEIVPREVTPS